MTTKTLGQVLYEAEYERELAEFAAHGMSAPYAALTREEKAECERIAQAVAAVERERCAQACDDYGNRCVDDYEVATAEHLACAIRSMK